MSVPERLWLTWSMDGHGPLWTNMFEKPKDIGNVVTEYVRTDVAEEELKAFAGFAAKCIAKELSPTVVLDAFRLAQKEGRV